MRFAFYFIQAVSMVAMVGFVAMSIAG